MPSLRAAFAASMFLLLAAQGLSVAAPAQPATKRPRLAGHHTRDETMDPLVVARKRGRPPEPDVRARSASRRRHRRRGDHADLRRPRRRVPVHSLPVRILGGDAQPRVAGSAAPRSRCRHGDRHGLAIRRTVDRRDQCTPNGLAPHVDARTGPGPCGPDPVSAGATDARTAEPGVRGRRKSSPANSRPPGPLNSRGRGATCGP